MTKKSFSLRKNKIVGLAPVLLTSTMLVAPSVAGAVPLIGNAGFGLQTVYAAEVTNVTISDLKVTNSREVPITEGMTNGDNELRASYKVKSNSPTNKGDVLILETHDIFYHDSMKNREIKDSSGKLIGVVKKVENLSNFGEPDHSKLTIELADNFNSFEFDVNTTVGTRYIFYTKNPPTRDKSIYIYSGNNQSNKINYKFTDWNMHKGFSARVDTEISDENLKSTMPIWLRERFDGEGKDLGIPEGTVKITLPEGYQFNNKLKVGDKLQTRHGFKVEESGRVVPIEQSEKTQVDLEVLEVTKNTVTIKVPKQEKDNVLKWYFTHINDSIDVVDSSKAIQTKEKRTNNSILEFTPNDKNNKTYEDDKRNENNYGTLNIYYLDGSAEIKTTPTTITYVDGEKPVGTEDKGNRIPGEKIVDLKVPDGYERTDNETPEVPTNGKVTVPVKPVKKAEEPKPDTTPETPKEGSIEVVHKSDTGEVLNRETLKGVVGQDFKTSAKTFDGYKLIKSPEKETGKYTEATQSFEYVYHKSVTKYVDEEGNPITEEEGNDPSKYTFVREEVDPKTGDITRIYHKVVTKFVDENGKVIQEKDGVHDKEDLDGFEFERTEKLENGDVIHHYKKKEAPKPTEPKKEIPTPKTEPKELPKTGETNTASMSLLGLGLLGAMGATTLKKRKED